LFAKSRKGLNFFRQINLYKKDLISDTKEIIDKLKIINNRFPTGQEKNLEDKCNKLINALDLIKNRYEFKYAKVIFWISAVLGILNLIGAFQAFFALRPLMAVCLFIIPGGVFLIVAIVLYVYYSKRNKFIDMKLNRLYLLNSETEQYIQLIDNLIKEKTDKSKEKFENKFDEIQTKLKILGNNLQAKQDRDLSSLKSEMQSYSKINMAINNLVSCYGEKIYWSSDYMNLFEKNFYLEINDEKEFLDACRDLIEKKRKEDLEEEERQRAEYERRKAQEEIERHNRAIEHAQREQLENLKRLQDKEREAASSLCYSCKNYVGCGLRHNLTSPVCSKYQSKYK